MESGPIAPGPSQIDIDECADSPVAFVQLSLLYRISLYPFLPFVTQARLKFCCPHVLLSLFNFVSKHIRLVLRLCYFTDFLCVSMPLCFVTLRAVMHYPLLIYKEDLFGVHLQLGRCCDEPQRNHTHTHTQMCTHAQLALRKLRRTL